MTMQIKDILIYNKMLAVPFDFKIAKTAKIIFSDADVQSVFRLFKSWRFDSIYDTEQQIWQDFTEFYTLWVNRNIDSIEKVMDGWNADYNAIENYDKRVEGSSTIEHHKGTKTSTNIDVSMNGGGTHKEKNKQTDSKNAFNGGLSEVGSTQGLDTDNASSDTSNQTTTGSAQNNYTTTQDIDDTHYDKDVSTYNGYREHGNIGVQTAASMLLSELSMRRQDVIMQFIKTFIKEVCFYVSC